MSGQFRISPTVSLPLVEVAFRTSRSSGPGGQHANTTDSRVEAVFDVLASETLSSAQKERITRALGARVTAVAQDGRSQARNRELALERLGERLAAALYVSRPRRPTKPTKGAQQRRLKAKREQSARKQDRRRPLGDD